MKFKTRLSCLVGLGLFALALGVSAETGPALRHILREYRGVSLDDLADSKRGFAPVAKPASALKGYLEGQPDLRLRRVVSRSLHGWRPVDSRGAVAVVDIFGNDRRFSVNAKRDAGGYGFLRVELALSLEDADGGAVVTGHKLLSQRDYVEMRPEMFVSLRDRLAVLVDRETDFRRSFPLDVGAIDDVRGGGETILMTPTTESSVLDKEHLTERKCKPGNYRCKPYINLNPALAAAIDGKPVRHRTSKIAFHIWQSPEFSRGFLSHGCMRMREADLHELLRLVQGARDVIPIRVRMEATPGARHPFPHLTSWYEKVRNFGTPSHPYAKKVKDKHGVWLTKTIPVQGNPPPLPEIHGRTMDPQGYGPSLGPALEENDDAGESDGDETADGQPQP